MVCSFGGSWSNTNSNGHTIPTASLEEEEKMLDLGHLAKVS